MSRGLRDLIGSMDLLDSGKGGSLVVMLKLKNTLYEIMNKLLKLYLTSINKYILLICIGSKMFKIKAFDISYGFSLIVIYIS